MSLKIDQPVEPAIYPIGQELELIIAKEMFPYAKKFGGSVGICRTSKYSNEVEMWTPTKIDAHCMEIVQKYRLALLPAPGIGWYCGLISENNMLTEYEFDNDWKLAVCHCIMHQIFKG